MSFLPFAIWRLDVSLSQERLKPAVEAGAIWGLSALGGYPGLTVVTAIYLGLWSAGRVITSPSAEGMSVGRRLKWSALSVATALLAGIVVLAPTYVGFFVDGAGYADRVGALPRSAAVMSNALHPRALATFASPYLPTLDMLNSGLWGDNDVSSCSIYVGPAVVLLAVAAIIAGERQRWRWYLIGLALVSIGLAVGGALPLRGWLYDWVLPTRYFRHASMFRGYFIFTLVVLALYGARDLDLADDAGRTRIAITAIVLAGVALTAFRMTVAGVKEKGDGLIWAQVHAGFVWWGVVLIVLIGRRWTQTWSMVPFLVLTLATVDAFWNLSLSRPIVYESGPEHVDWWQQVGARRRRSLDLTPRGIAREAVTPVGPPVSNHNLLLKVPVLGGYSPFSSRFFQPWAREPVLREAATGETRMWFGESSTEVAPSDGCFHSFVERSRVLGAPPIVLHTRKSMLSSERNLEDAVCEAEQQVAIARLPTARRVVIKLIAYTPDRLAFQVDAPGDGWLLVTDRWARGWKATANGVPVEVKAADFAFRAVYLSRGSNEIDFRYSPFGFPWLLIASWGTLALVAISAAYAGWIRASRPRHL